MIMERKAGLVLIFTFMGILQASPPYRCFFGVQPAASFDPQERYSSYPYISSDTFRAMSDHIIDETNLPFNPSDVKEGDLIYVRGYPICLNEFVNRLPFIKNKFILITHNTDDTMPGSYEFLLQDPRIVAWFTQNKGAIDHPKLHILPIGIACNYWHYGDSQMLTDVLTSLHSTENKYFLYVNFNAKTNAQARDHVLEYFQGKPYCFFSEPKPWKDYLLDLADSQFVLSPPGNGLDCYRAWEALLFGKIPVMFSTSIDCLFDDLPVIIVNDWAQVTQEFLEKQYQEMQKKTYKLEKIYADYWIDQIRAIQAKVRNKKEKYS